MQNKLQLILGTFIIAVIISGVTCVVDGVSLLSILFGPLMVLMLIIFIFAFSLIIKALN